MSGKAGEIRLEEDGKRRVRADAQRNLDALLSAALAVFTTSGVDAPVREIAEKAGVGVGTLYRHFPQRSDLIIAVFRQEVDACADAATSLAARHEPGEALALWMHRYADFIAAKRGLGAALHSGDPAYDVLPGYFKDRLVPALQMLLETAAAAGAIRQGFDATDLLRAAAVLASPSQDREPDHGRRMVGLLVDGLRYGANPSA
ncbi:helix-turn-helix domain-containing protein [Nitrospirillum sp. BR 11752]|uniref:TetR/AcrR family transcriptional regulator n=1 Tax=Nitrospirillum sp. BR 11752 TaxID=3104293 RepID=UPI002EB5C3AB|nr:helix-turn-helix domain-containing protein [Nitrospirillum sp. BR 11752]